MIRLRSRMLDCMKYWLLLLFLMNALRRGDNELEDTHLKEETDQGRQDDNHNQRIDSQP